MSAVISAPTRIATIGLLSIIRISLNCGRSASGSTASLISVIPVIKREKPIHTEPTSFFLLLLQNMMRMMPISAMTGEKFSGFKSWTKTLSLVMPDRLRIHAVTVVPMLEPMITPTDWPSSMMPEFTRPTSMTVMAEEDWIAMVMTMPSRRLLKRLEVMERSTRSSLPPTIFSRLDESRCMPYKKNARPPKSVITEKMSIEFCSSFVYKTIVLPKSNFFFTFSLHTNLF